MIGEAFAFFHWRLALNDDQHQGDWNCFPCRLLWIARQLRPHVGEKP